MTMALKDDKAQGEDAQLTFKQEAFARAFVECGNASEAYRRSYNCKPDAKPETIHVAASQTLAIHKVSTRVAELKAKAAERTEITLQDIARMLQEAHQVGAKGDDASAMTEAAMSLAKLLGHYTEKKHVTSDNRNHNVEEKLSTGAEWLGGLLGPGAKASDKASSAH
jgi:phage terminase small subunit